jgi:hypothetical protein
MFAPAAARPLGQLTHKHADVRPVAVSWSTPSRSQILQILGQGRARRSQSSVAPLPKRVLLRPG